MWFVSLPAEIEAFQFLSNRCMNLKIFDSEHILSDGSVKETKLYVTTTHGQKVYVEHGDWIVKEPDGNGYYPVKPHIFEKRWKRKFPEDMRTVVQQQLNAWCDGLKEQAIQFYTNARELECMQMLKWLGLNRPNDVVEFVSMVEAEMQL